VAGREAPVSAVDDASGVGIGSFATSARDRPIPEVRARLYARQAYLKMHGSDFLRQPPVPQFMHSLVRIHGVPLEQLVQEWHELLDAHPFVEVVSLSKRVALKRDVLGGAEEREEVLKFCLSRSDLSLRRGLETEKKPSWLNITTVWEDWKPRSAFRRLFQLLPDGFFDDVGALFSSVVKKSGVAPSVEVSDPFLPKRIQLNVYPAGKESGVPEHWDRHPMVGVVTVLLSEVEEGEQDDLFVNEEFREFPGGEGWQPVGLRQGSAVCLLGGTTHAIRTRTRKRHRVTLNIMF